MWGSGAWSRWWSDNRSSSPRWSARSAAARGRLSVQPYFSASTKERYTRLTGEIFDAFRERIRRLDWMTPPTKERALRKLDAVVRKVGYPERWKDYSAYRVERGSFLANAVRGHRWRSEYAIAKLHRPVDRTEWD